MKPSKTRIAVIGAGMLARSMHIPNILRMDDAELQVCCDLSDASLAECERIAPGVELSKDFESVVRDPNVDAIVLATSETFRIPIIECAAEFRKPVYCEKPLARNLVEALRIQKIIEESGIPFCVGHNRRCSPAMIEGQRIFAAHMREPGPCGWRFSRDASLQERFAKESGSAGLSIRINDDWWSWKSVHLEGENSEIGLLVIENTHFADIACWFLQAKPLEVTTVFTGLLLHQVSIKFEGGHLASIFSCANGSFGYPKELYEAMGRGGVVVVDHMLEVRTAGIAGAPSVQRFPMLADRHPQAGKEGGLHGWMQKKRAACEESAAARDPMVQFTAEPDKGHARMLGEFLKEIRGERGPVSPVADAVTAMRICLASVMSKREKRTVRITEIQ